MLLPFLLTACTLLAPPDDDGNYVDEPEIAGPPGFWALAHRTDPPARGAGVYLVDTSLGSATGPVVVPEALVSPHALFDDGAGLLVGGVLDGPEVGESSIDFESVFRLDYDGTELATYAQPSTEGITVGDDGTVYVADGSTTVHARAADWSLVADVEVESVVQDIAIHDRTLYVLSNDDHDTIRSYDLDDPGAGAVVVSEASTFSNEGYAMMVWDDRLLVADKDDGGNFLRHLDLVTGEPLGITRFSLGGWITAIGVPAE